MICLTAECRHLTESFQQLTAEYLLILEAVDHDSSHAYASTDEGSLTLYEDDIGLHADVLVTDAVLIDLAKRGKIKGWSFGMYNVVDEVEPRADDLPLRRIKALDLDHLTLVVNKTPVYSATSVEIRADTEVDVETRGRMASPRVTAPADGQEPARPRNEAYHRRLEAIKK